MKPLISKPHAVGFTGTQRGITAKQRDGIAACLAFAYLPGAEFHHGGCIGADIQAAAIAKSIGYTVIEWPGCDAQGRQPKWARYKGNDHIMPKSPYMLRNRYIVDVSHEMYATPGEVEEQLRSGTWSTIRKARKKGIYVGIVGPNGEAL